VLERCALGDARVGPNISAYGPVGAGKHHEAIKKQMACVKLAGLMEAARPRPQGRGYDRDDFEVVRRRAAAKQGDSRRIPPPSVPRNFAPGPSKGFLMNKDLET